MAEKPTTDQLADYAVHEVERSLPDTMEAKAKTDATAALKDVLKTAIENGNKSANEKTTLTNKEAAVLAEAIYEAQKAVGEDGDKKKVKIAPPGSTAPSALIPPEVYVQSIVGDRIENAYEAALQAQSAEDEKLGGKSDDFKTKAGDAVREKINENIDAARIKTAAESFATMAAEAAKLEDATKKEEALLKNVSDGELTNMKSDAVAFTDTFKDAMEARIAYNVRKKEIDKSKEKLDDKSLTEDEKKELEGLQTKAKEKEGDVTKKYDAARDRKNGKGDKYTPKQLEVLDKVLQTAVDNHRDANEDLHKEFLKNSDGTTLGSSITGMLSTDRFGKYFKLETAQARAMGAAASSSGKGWGLRDKLSGNVGLGVVAVGTAAAAAAALFAGRETDPQTKQKKPRTVFRWVAGVTLGALTFVAASMAFGAKWTDRIRTGVGMQPRSL